LNQNKESDGEIYGSKEFIDSEFENPGIIKQMMDRGEQVQFVARQSKFRPGGSFITPDMIFVTNKRIIIRDPSLLGVRENIVSISYDKITSIEFEKGVFSYKIIIKAPGLTDEIEAISKNVAEQIMRHVKNSMEKIKISTHEQTIQAKALIADELLKFVNLREKGVINDEEFLKMKQDLLSRMQE
jgi:Bacterial PH domain